MVQFSAEPYTKYLKIGNLSTLLGTHLETEIDGARGLSSLALNTLDNSSMETDEAIRVKIYIYLSTYLFYA